MARTILIVEDDRAVAGTLEIGLLAVENVDTVTVFDGRDAIDYLERHPAPALVLTDLDLPRVDGFHLISWMRSQPKLLRTPVLAMSARASAGSDARASGANDFLPKPSPLAAIRSRIQELLNA